MERSDLFLAKSFHMPRSVFIQHKAEGTVNLRRASPSEGDVPFVVRVVGYAVHNARLLQTVDRASCRKSALRLIALQSIEG